LLVQIGLALFFFEAYSSLKNVRCHHPFFSPPGARGAVFSGALGVDGAVDASAISFAGALPLPFTGFAAGSDLVSASAFVSLEALRRERDRERR